MGKSDHLLPSRTEGPPAAAAAAAPVAWHAMLTLDMEACIILDFLSFWMTQYHVFRYMSRNFFSPKKFFGKTPD
jgi:hypothetical protein